MGPKDFNDVHDDNVSVTSKDDIGGVGDKSKDSTCGVGDTSRDDIGGAGDADGAIVGYDD